MGVVVVKRGQAVDAASVDFCEVSELLMGGFAVRRDERWPLIDKFVVS
ncbi:hypothetical protein [Mycobacterium lepromatosis]|nr:hypothetical protein [Mycobacterium lepromatosis]